MTRRHGAVLAVAMLLLAACTSSSGAPEEIEIANLRLERDTAVQLDVDVAVTRAATDERPMLPAAGPVELDWLLSRCILIFCTDFEAPTHDVVLPAGTAFSYCLDPEDCTEEFSLVTRAEVVVPAGVESEPCIHLIIGGEACIRTHVSVQVEGTGPFPSYASTPYWSRDGKRLDARMGDGFDRGQAAGMYLSDDDVEAALVEAQDQIMASALPAALDAWPGATADEVYLHPIWWRLWSINAVSGQMIDAVDVALDRTVTLHVLTRASIANQVQAALEERASRAGVTIDPATITYQFHGPPESTGSNGLPWVSARARVGTPTGPAPLPTVTWQPPPPELPEEPSPEFRFQDDNRPAAAPTFSPPAPLEPLPPQPTPTWVEIAFDGIEPRAQVEAWNIFRVEETVSTSGTLVTVTEDDIERAKEQVRQTILADLSQRLEERTEQSPPQSERWFHLDGTFHVDREPGETATEVTARFDGTAYLSWLTDDNVHHAVTTRLFFDYGPFGYDKSTITWELYTCDSNRRGLPCARGTAMVKQESDP